ncbi:MAG TPA: hypothetical protein VH796_07355 [Nitrososphaeraceae archaeon]
MKKEKLVCIILSLAEVKKYHLQQLALIPKVYKRLNFAFTVEHNKKIMTINQKFKPN